MDSKVVLIAEDDADLRALLALLLEGQGFRVVEARDGREALDAVARKAPDLVLLDMKMPVMDGWEFAERLHAAYDGRIPVVVMTAADSAALRAREVGADGWLAKPFVPEDLFKVVRTQLRP